MTLALTFPGCDTAWYDVGAVNYTGYIIVLYVMCDRCAIEWG